MRHNAKEGRRKKHERRKKIQRGYPRHKGGAEKDKDRFCKAARIEREPMSDKRLVTLLNYAVGTLAMVMGFAALYMVIYFMGTSGR